MTPEEHITITIDRGMEKSEGIPDRADHMCKGIARAGDIGKGR